LHLCHLLLQSCHSTSVHLLKIPMFFPIDSEE
jgi:hypothetical protein